VILGMIPGRPEWDTRSSSPAPERAQLLECGVVDVRASTTAAERLLAISKALDLLIRRHRPFVLAVERLYFNKNVQTAMRVSEARGVALLCGARAGLEIAEYNPAGSERARSPGPVARTSTRSNGCSLSSSRWMRPSRRTTWPTRSRSR